MRAELENKLVKGAEGQVWQTDTSSAVSKKLRIVRTDETAWVPNSTPECFLRHASSTA